MSDPEDKVLGLWDKLEIRDDERLYYDGKPVKTSLELQGWTLIAAMLGGIGAIVSAVFAALTYVYPSKVQAPPGATSSISSTTTPALPKSGESAAGSASTKIEVQEPLCPNKKR